MVKKLKSISEKKSSPAAGLLDGQLAQSVKDSAQQIWLAGMGAFAKAQEEGGKVFESLVKEGTSLQRKTQGLAEDKISEVTGKMSAMAGTVTAKAGQNWDKLEAIFEQRTAKAMSKLGVPTAKDIDSLSQRVEELAAAVAKMGKAGGSVRATAPAKKVSKPAAKAPGQTASKPVAKAATSKAANKAANKTVAAKRTRKAAV
jgi:poly(hydroxyalkanoate) granule-associated protein